MDDTQTATALNKQDAPTDILARETAEAANYQETDVFAWANNLVQYKDELKVDLFFFNKNYVVYKTTRSKALDKQMEPIFIDEILEYVLEGAANGLIVRSFEEAEAEENVLMRTRLANVERAKEVLNWLKHQAHEIETFDDEEHDIKRMKGVLARVSHPEMDKSFYVIKQLQQSQIIRGKTGWMIREGKFVPFDADAALRVGPENQLLVLEQDMYVFNPAKLKSLFGYDAKEASIAAHKVREIEENFRLSYAEGLTLQSLVKGNKAAIKKLQKVEPSQIKQDDLVDHAEELGVPIMVDEAGAIIIMDEKDMTRFVNLLNDDYIESPLTGLRYEIKTKRILKPADEDDLLKEVTR
jgi:Kiwa KwaB-like protein